MSSLPGSQHIPLPNWTIILRGIQFVLAIIILGLSAYGLYWIHFAAWGLSLFTSLLTLLLTLYAILTTSLPSLHSLHNYIALLVLDSVAIIFWLASMADLAAQRAAFKYSTVIEGCYNNGNGGICYRDLGQGVGKREVNYVAGKGYLGAMVAAAVFSAFEMLLFVATLAILALNVHKHRTSTSTSSGGAAAAAAVTNDKIEAHAMPTYTSSSQTYTGVPQQQYPEVHPQNYGTPAPAPATKQYGSGAFSEGDMNSNSTSTYTGQPGTTYAELPNQQGQGQYPSQSHY